MDEFNWKELPIIIYVLLVGAAGGVVAGIEEQRNTDRHITMTERIVLLSMNAMTSGFAGMLTYWLYMGLVRPESISPLLFFLVGMSGWIGKDSLKVFRRIWDAYHNYNSNEPKK